MEAGTWSLVRAQPVAGWRVLVVKFALRAALVWLPLLALLWIAAAWLGLPIEGAWWLVAGATLAYLSVWLLVSMGISALGRSSDLNVLALLGVWVIRTALGPALVHVGAAARFPLPEALELTVLQRQGYHGAWDEPLPKVMAAFYQRYPEWREAPVPHDRHANAWYCAKRHFFPVIFQETQEGQIDWSAAPHHHHRD